MNVHIVDSNGHAHTIKTVKAGETVSSLLSFIDCLTGNDKDRFKREEKSSIVNFPVSGHANPFKTVCCKAVTDSVVIKLPASAFADVFDKNPDMLIRVIQVRNTNSMFNTSIITQ